MAATHYCCATIPRMRHTTQTLRLLDGAPIGAPDWIPDQETVRYWLPHLMRGLKLTWRWVKRRRVRVRTISTDYSFTRAPFVPPRVLHDLETGLSDTGDQVVAINLSDSCRSNRYHGELGVQRVAKGPPFVFHEERDANGECTGSFGYRYIGMTRSGVQVLQTSENGGGSGWFIGVLFAVIESDHGLSSPDSRSGRIVRHTIDPGRERIVLRKLLSLPLGDRWDGELRVDGNDLIVGEDQGWFSQAEGLADRELRRESRHRIEFRPAAPLDLALHRTPG